MPVRRAVFAAQGWYPSNRVTLLKRLEGDVPPREDAGEALAAVAPHAGYDYSGAVAGALYARVVVPDDVIVLCVNHGHGWGAEFALFDEGAWETPLGPVPVAEELVAAIREHCPLAKPDCRVHDSEHSGEIQLPFLRYRNPQVRVAVICIASSSFASVCELGRGLARAAQAVGRPVLVVASTDLSHEQPFELPDGTPVRGPKLAAYVRDQDQKVIDAVLALDERALWDAVHHEGVSMCGFAPTTAAVVYANTRGATAAELVEHKTSAETPHGSYDYIVGYAGILIR